MISDALSALTSLISAHPHWIGFAVFTATALESMAVVGSLIPGMSMVLVLSGISASLGANVWMLVLWCTLGAIVGDGASYWIGHRFGDQLKTMWPFRTRPELLEKGTDFFQRNGGKSIIIGRFLPFMRAVVPVAAGMLGMNPTRFYVANMLSAVAWALINILPAAGIGLAFSVINQVSSRVAVLLCLFAGIFLLALLAGHGTARFLWPRLAPALSHLVGSLNNGPKWATASTAFALGSAPRPATRSAAWVILILGLAVFFAKILEDIITNDPLVRMDVALNALIQGFRSPLGDQIMVTLTLMGDMTTVLWASTALLGGLLIARAWRTSATAILVLVASAIFVPLLKWMLHKPRPIDLYSGVDAFSFPSGHAAFSALLLGLIAVIGSRGRSAKTKATIWAMAFTVSILIGLSRIYLSAHWPSDVIGGLLFGWTMASLFGLLEGRIRDRLVHPGRLASVVAITLITAWGLHATAAFDKNLAQYQPTHHVTLISVAEWREKHAADNPTSRVDLKGEYEEPLSFQIAVSPTAIEQALHSSGWTRIPLMEWHQARQFVGENRDIASLIPLPLLHNGAPPVLTMIAASDAYEKRNVFRLWQTKFRIADLPERPMLIVASITQEGVSHPLNGINVLRDSAVSVTTRRQTVTALQSSPDLCLFRSSHGNDTTTPWLITSRKSRPCPTDLKSDNSAL